MKEYICSIMPRHKKYSVPERSEFPDLSLYVLYIWFPGLCAVPAEYFNIIVYFIGFYPAFLIFLTGEFDQIFQYRFIPFAILIEKDFMQDQFLLLLRLYLKVIAPAILLSYWMPGAIFNCCLTYQTMRYH